MAGFRLAILAACLAATTAQTTPPPQIDSVSPHEGSLNGEARITIHGQGFAQSQFSFGTGNGNLGNEVDLVSSTQTYSCRIHPDGCTTTQITCYTPEMPQDDYYVRVTVDGVAVPVSSHCTSPKDADCRFTPRGSVSPTISRVFPRSGLPGTLVNLTGQIFTSRYGSNVGASTNGRTAKILRVYFGGQKCELKQTSDDLYGIELDDEGEADTGTMVCKPQGTYVGNVNISSILDQNFGRSNPELGALFAGAQDKIYMFQAYAEVSGVSPSTGSLQGGTRMTISGQFFDDTIAPASVVIADQPCIVVSMTDTEIICETPKLPSSMPGIYAGGRGITFEMWNATTKTFNTLPSVSSMTSADPNYLSDWQDDFTYEDDLSDNYVTKFSGFFQPPASDSYTFYLKADDRAILYLSQSGFPQHKAMIASVSSAQSSYFSKTSQKSGTYSLSSSRRYYLEVVHAEGSKAAHVSVGVRRKMSPYGGKHTGTAKDEIQNITTTSTVHTEVQTLTLSGFGSQPYQKEVQTVTVTTSNPAVNSLFRLAVDGAFTDLLSIAASDADVAAALDDLPTVHPDTVTVARTAATGGFAYEVTFNSGRGTRNMMTFTTQPVAPATVTVTVARTQAGNSSGEYVTPTYLGLPGPTVLANDTAHKVRMSVRAIFGPQCPRSTVQPAGAAYFSDFENGDKFKSSGEVTSEFGSFCGVYATLNPTYLFQTSGVVWPYRASTYRQVCFAYSGDLQQQIKVKWHYFNSTQHQFNAQQTFPATFPTTSPGSWEYVCTDIYTPVRAASAAGLDHKIERVEIARANALEDVLVDAIYLGQVAPADITGLKTVRRLMPTAGVRVRNVGVTSTAAGVYDVEVDPWECANTFQLLGLANAQVSTGSLLPSSASAGFSAVTWPSAAQASVSRAQTATPPVGGTFDIYYRGQWAKLIAANATYGNVKAALEGLPGVGIVNVTRWGDCTGYSWEVLFQSIFGDHNSFAISSSTMTGTGVSMALDIVQDGGLFYNPITGDMLRTVHTKPQVQVYINNVPSWCSGSCDFEWASSVTPSISSTSPSTGSPASSTVLTVTGVGFSATASDNDVTIGGVSCSPVTAATVTQLTCSVGNGPVGAQAIKVNVAGKGLASGSHTFIYTSSISSISPTSGSLGGGTLLTITGNGFSGSDVPQVGGQACVVVESHYSNMTCRTPAASAGSVAVTLQQTTGTLTASNQFRYSAAHTAIITSGSSVTPTVEGGQTITLTGSGFGSAATSANSVRVGDYVMTVTSYSNTQIVATLPAAPQGTYPVIVEVAGGFASGAPSLTYVFQVDLVTPGHGSIFGGTRLTIVGSGFSTTAANNEVTVGDVACEVTLALSTQLVCEVGNGGTTHIIDNSGEHPVNGKGYSWSEVAKAVNIGDIVRWEWTTPAQVSGVGYRVEQTANSTAEAYDGSGFISGAAATANGAYEYQFTAPGQYFYWSGFVEPTKTIFLRGAIWVNAFSSRAENVKVKIGDVEADYNLGSATSATPVGSCVGTTASVPGCSVAKPAASNSALFPFAFWECATPEVTSFTPTQGASSETLTVVGSGFTTTACQNEVTVGGQPCTVTAATATQIQCSINHGNTLAAGVLHDVIVKVNNLGNTWSHMTEPLKRTFGLVPEVSGLSVTTGSLAGGTSLVISGSGFSGAVSDTTVDIGGAQCDIQSLTYTSITCLTGPSVAQTAPVSVSIAVGSASAASKCTASSCGFSYSTSVTPSVTAVSPTTVSGASTSLTISGTGFVAGLVAVTVGGVPCTVTATSATQVICTIGAVAVGNKPFTLTVAGQGLAQSTIATLMSTPVLSSVTPTQGSTAGGTTVVLVGSGFNTSDVQVTVGGNPCTVDTSASSISSVTCVTSAGSGAANVQVTSNGVSFPTVSYTYQGSITPALTAVSPTSALSGGSISILGSQFSSVMLDNTVSIDGSPCSVTASSPNQIQCNVGAHTAGTYPVVVNVAGVGIAAGSTTFSYQLSLSGVTPTQGSFGGGSTITLAGQGFSSASTVTVCGDVCDVTSATTTAIECKTPANSGTGATAACGVAVSEGSANQRVNSAFTYDATLTPEVTGVSPARGGTGGGTSITITGTGFGSVMSAVSVEIAGSVCIVSSVANTQVVCSTGSHSPSVEAQVEVYVGSTGMAKQTSADFFYVDVWSSPFSWGNGPLPTDGDMVVVPAGQTMMIDMDTPVLKMLLIDGGKVIFDQKNIELSSENILIANGGHLEVGTETDPFSFKGIITLHGHFRSPELPIYGAKTLAVREGTLDLHGLRHSVTWTVLGATAPAGSTTITLQVPVTWNVGDEIVIATSGLRHSQSENEMHEITAISPNGLTLTLAQPLAHAHEGQTVTLPDGTTFDVRAEVGLLTHNVVVRGSSNIQWADKIEACPEGFNTGEFTTQTCFQGRFGEEMGSDQFGGAIMIHPPAKDQDLAVARIHSVEVTHVGQAFRLGRYPIHFHLLGQISMSYVRDSAIHHTFNRAVNVHGTHGLLVQRNVVYDVMGGAFFLEDGVETGNTFEYNLAVFVRQSTSLLNDDVTPAAFWVTNPNNTLRHNHAAGGTHFGFWYRMHEHPDGPSFDATICPRKVPLGEFFNNTVHSQGWFGIWIFQDYYPVVGGHCWSSTPEPARFYHLKAWNNEKGAETVNCGSVQFVDFVMVHNEKAGIEMKLVMAGAQYDPTGFILENSKVASSLPAIWPGSATKRGIILPYSGGLIVNGTTLMDFTGSAAAFGVTSIDGTCVVLCGGFIYKLYGVNFINSPNGISWRWTHEGVLEDMDGTLTGTAGTRVVPGNPTYPPSCVQKTIWSHGVAGVECPGSVKFHRMAFNNISPIGIKFKDAFFINQYGTTRVPYAFKRLTHKEGWMGVLVSGVKTRMVFENAGMFTNISYTGKFYDFEPNDYVVLEHNLTNVPDRFAVLAGSAAVPNNDSALPLTFSTAYNGDFNYDNNTKDFSFLVSGNTRRRRRGGPGASYVPGAYTAEDRPVQLNVFRCLYEGCISPPSPTMIPPARDRPDPYNVWSNTTLWADMAEPGWGGGAAGLPVAGDDVWIKEDEWVVADMALPVMGTLLLDGVLELDYLPDKTTGAVRDYTLNCTYIIIRKGRLVVGWTDNPYTGNANIVLRGSHATPDYPEKMGPAIGSKVMAVFGGLDLHGNPRDVTWTHLANQANPGDTQITVQGATDWGVGDDIMVASTSFNSSESEIFTITAVASAGALLTLDKPVQFKHISHFETFSNGKTLEMRAEVGLLTHNIKVIGDAYPRQQAESFGARVLVSTTVLDGLTYVGYARVQSTEFVRAGQEGFIDAFDPRFSLAFLNTGAANIYRPSFVRGNSFRAGYNTAVGSFGTLDLNVTDNVIHHTPGIGLRDEGSSTRIERNLVALSLFRGTYNGRFETFNVDYSAGIDVAQAFSPIMHDNAVAGSERMGFHVAGESCANGATGSWSGNVAHGTLIGVYTNFDDPFDANCILIQGFTVWKAFRSGIYVQAGTKHMVTANNTLADNTIGAYHHLIGPSALGHSKFDNTIIHKDSVVVGTSPAFDCTTDVVNSNDPNIKLSATSVSFNTGTGGKIGYSWPTFSEGSNMAPKKPMFGIMSYPSNGGLMTVQDVTMAHFGVVCGTQRDAAFGTSPKNEDGQHPIRTQRLTLEPSVTADSKAFIHFASLGVVNPADCVDMDCDAKKKSIIEDVDGTLLGSPGVVLPFAEQEWDGDARHGVGDYRIPKAMLSYPNGSRIPIGTIVKNRGLSPNANCVNRTGTWQAYECTGMNLDYEMLLIENMDADTETRRLSPVAVLADGYLDLINGPQDHGWCSGYTCQKRLSTFMAMAKIGSHHDIYFTSTSPAHLRFYLLNSVPSQAITTAVYYKTPKRMDTYADAKYVMPTNAYLDSQGRQILRAPVSSGQYIPTASDPSGTNYQDREMMLLYTTIAGPAMVEKIMQEVVIVSFDMPTMTISQFYGDQLADNLAAFLGLTPDKVRMVEAVDATGSSLFGRRKRRQTGTSTYVLEVGGTPPNGSFWNSSGMLTTVQLDISSSMIVDATQLGNISGPLNTTVLSVYLTEYLPGSNTPLWDTFAAQGTDGSYYVQTPAYITIDTQPVVLHEGAPFSTQPKIQAIDINGDPIEYLGSRNHPWELTAVIRNGSNPNGAVIGTTTIPFNSGWANFSDIGISHAGNYIVDFVITKPAAAANFTVSSIPLVVPTRPLLPTFPSLPAFVTVGAPFTVQVDIRDNVTGQVVTNLAWRGHTWSATVSLNSHSVSGSVLSGTTSAAFNLVTGTATVTGLMVSKEGGHVFDVAVTSTPAEYQLSGVSDAVLSYSSGYTQATGGKHTVQLRFTGDYVTMVAGMESLFTSGLMTKLHGLGHPVHYQDFNVTADTSAGTTLVYFAVMGPVADRNSSLSSLWLELQRGVTVPVNTAALTAHVHMQVDGQPYFGTMLAEESTFPLAAIIGISCVAALALAAVVGYLIWRKKKLAGSTKVEDWSNSSREEIMTERNHSSLSKRVATPSNLSLNFEDDVRRQALSRANERFLTSRSEATC